MKRLADGYGDAVHDDGRKDEKVVDGDEHGAEVFGAWRRRQGGECDLGVEDCSDALGCQ
jgi:hypothetical protein